MTMTCNLLGVALSLPAASQHTTSAKIPL